jgi:hypothetical protein
VFPGSFMRRSPRCFLVTLCICHDYSALLDLRNGFPHDFNMQERVCDYLSVLRNELYGMTTAWCYNLEVKEL